MADDERHRIPVILDTDIGTDVDDTWALTMLLNSPELDLKLVVTETGDTEVRARIVAKMLEIGGRTDVPVGIGLRTEDLPIHHAGWVEGYDLCSYPGSISDDGVGALIDMIMAAPEPITLICIGPVPNIAAALEREPAIAGRARFVGMHGSVRRGYGGRPQIDAEYNVVRDPQACQQSFAAPWEVTITPVDTCGLVRLTGEKYRAVRDSSAPLARALMENYRLWAAHANPAGGIDPDVCSSTLFDPVAVYLAFFEELLVMERLGIRVTDDGYTRIDETAKEIKCATAWRDLGAFEDLLVERLIRR